MYKRQPLFCKECDVVEYKEQKTLKSRTNRQAKREKERFSIIYRDLTKCCNCGSKIGIEKNEVFEGSYRQISIRYGMVCPFCKTCHTQFHNDIMLNLFYKVMFEKEFLKTHSKEEFIKIVENFAVPAGKGESGRDHVQSYNKHFKANAEDFYNIPNLHQVKNNL